MLLELRAENYAVIDHATAALGPGLNLLTGETGAGKSILVDALALLLGGKASSEVVRHGAEKAVVSCVFEATDEAERILEAHGIDAGDGEILLRREIAASGKGRVFVNNQPATAAVLKLLAPELALIHAQSETLAGFDPNAAAAAAGSLRRHLDRSGPLRHTRRGANARTSCKRWRAMSRNGCAWRTCGASSRVRSSQPRSRWGRWAARDRKARAEQRGETLRGRDERL